MFDDELRLLSDVVIRYIKYFCQAQFISIPRRIKSLQIFGVKILSVYRCAQKIFMRNDHSPKFYQQFFNENP